MEFSRVRSVYVLFIPLLITALLAISCNLFTKDKLEDDDFALYLVDADTMTAYVAVEIELDSLIIADEPILSLSDITAYDWSVHCLTISPTAYNRMESFLGEYATNIDLRGTPFVTMVGEERIYLGAFWNPVSSIPPPCPAITFPPLTELPLTLIIMPSWVDDAPDQRSDPRIREVLDASGVLQE